MAIKNATPSARQAALKQGLDLDVLQAEHGGKFLRIEDLTTPRPTTTPGGQNTDKYWAVDHAAYGPVHLEKMSKFAQTATAKLLAATSCIPQVTNHDYAVIDSLEAFRQSKKRAALDCGVRLTLLPFIVYALARCLNSLPVFNTSLAADKVHLVWKKYVHIGVAVDTPTGLYVPVIRNADQKGVYQIAREIVNITNLAKERKLQADQMGGASITISSLGILGGTAFTPIVNPPEIAILGISRAEPTLVLDSHQQPVFEQRLPLSLSYDHRVINGVAAAKFLNKLRTLLGSPEMLAFGAPA